jgi:citrate synthase
MIRDRMPRPGEARMMDVILSSILDHGLHKSGTVAARCVVSVNPQMTAGLGAAVLAAGEHALSPEDTGRFITEAHKAWKASGEGMDAFAVKMVERLRAEAVAGGVWSEVGELCEAIHRAFRIAAGKPDILINDVGMMASILAGTGYTPQEMAGTAILSTIPGLIAHISEELASGRATAPCPMRPPSTSASGATSRPTWTQPAGRPGPDPLRLAARSSRSRASSRNGRRSQKP